MSSTAETLCGQISGHIVVRGVEFLSIILSSFFLLIQCSFYSDSQFHDSIKPMIRLRIFCLCEHLYMTHAIIPFIVSQIVADAIIAFCHLNSAKLALILVQAASMMSLSLLKDKAQSCIIPPRPIYIMSGYGI